MIAAIEIYNKPVFEYREECVSVLLMNAWELALKALLDKNQKSIFCEQKGKGPRRSLLWRDALKRAERYFPKSISFHAVAENLRFLAKYRNNTLHYYNEAGMKTTFYMLAQSSVKNLVDLMDKAFDLHVSKEINWIVMPIGIAPPVDPVSYLSTSNAHEKSEAVRQFLSKLTESAHNVEQNNEDVSRLVSVRVKLVSAKQAGDAHIVVGLTDNPDALGATVLEKKIEIDPNKTHPHKYNEVVKKIGVLHGKKFTSHTFGAIAWKHGLKDNSRYCWKSSHMGFNAYSGEVLQFLKRLSEEAIEEALAEYKQHLARKRKRKVSARAMRA